MKVGSLFPRQRREFAKEVHAYVSNLGPVDQRSKSHRTYPLTLKAHGGRPMALAESAHPPPKEIWDEGL